MGNAEVRYKNQALKRSIKRAIKGKILDLHLKDKEKDAPDILKELKKWTREKYGNIKLPSLRTTQKYIYDYEHPKTSEEQERKEQNEALDKPWSISTLAKHELPAEALPTVLLIWSMSLLPPDKPLTIREAKWVSHLYRVVQNLDFLYAYAKYYADEERWEKIAGVPRGPISSFDALYTQRPVIEQALRQLRHSGLYTLEEIARSVFQRAPKGNEVFTDEAVQEAIAELSAETAFVAKEAQMPPPFHQIPQWVRDTIAEEQRRQARMATFPKPVRERHNSKGGKQ